MHYYQIEGKSRLHGEVQVQGCKNAALPILAATLYGGENVIENVPDIKDTRMMIEVLKENGCKTEFKNHRLVVDSRNAEFAKTDKRIISQMRASVLFAGVMAGRFGYAVLPLPGGCRIGKRPIDLHLSAFRTMGIQCTEEEDCIRLEGYPQGGKIELSYPSVGATENVMLAASSCDKQTTLIGAAKEPEISDLAEFLRKRGVKVFGDGTNQIVIYGCSQMKDTCHRLMPDRIVAGTFLAAAAATNGKVLVAGAEETHLKSFLRTLKYMGCQIDLDHRGIYLTSRQRLKSPGEINTAPYPGFPTDLQPILMSLLTTAEGKSMIRETVFEFRLSQGFELIKMGAAITICGRLALIEGKEKLYGAEVTAKDLRGGAALMIAGLMADGVTKIYDPGFVGRGYENIVGALCNLEGKVGEFI
ncbi:MAG: UDP-N-acetylglucosamine 1-carboxyvinyltransferase [Clostridiales bacterium]|nr:UDP-N-acetylglucosamine 1-carboxyvinyltransferase [Clostridiales bacterium]